MGTVAKCTTTAAWIGLLFHVTILSGTKFTSMHATSKTCLIFQHKGDPNNLRETVCNTEWNHAGTSMLYQCQWQLRYIRIFSSYLCQRSGRCAILSIPASVGRLGTSCMNMSDGRHEWGLNICFDGRRPSGCQALLGLSA